MFFGKTYVLQQLFEKKETVTFNYFVNVVVFIIATLSFMRDMYWVLMV